MKKDIINSSSKITGYTTIENDSIKIYNLDKPVLEITDTNLIYKIINKIDEDKVLEELYNHYLMSISEIASIYGTSYYIINNKIKANPNIIIDRKGRRNRAYGKQQSQETREKIRNKLIGKSIPSRYERTPEIKEKISQSLKKYYSKHPQDPTPHRENWKNGVYSKVNFKRGIGGSLFSLKNNKIIHFRSLLELYYLILLENNDNINSYEYETQHITLEDGTVYTPDIIIDNTIIELKSKKFIDNQPDIYERFIYKKEQCEKYCDEHGLKYQVIFDTDIGFDSRQMKKELKNHPEIIEKYQISFYEPERIWSQK